MDESDLSMLEAYKQFCSKYPLKKLSMPKSDLVWCYYDINPRYENVIVFLHGVCGTAGCFFYQMDYLAKLGCRVVSLQYPSYSSLKNWIKNLCNILEYLNIKKAHFFASDLGGYLIQLYSKLYPSRVESLILCNSYRSTEDFASISSLRSVYGKVYSFFPHILLKKIILENYIYLNYSRVDLKEKNSLEFMSNELDFISAADLGGRISLQLSGDVVDGIYVPDRNITIMQTLNNLHSGKINDDMRVAYPQAKHAMMKSGGQFPYLSRHEEVNLYVSVHLRNNCDPKFVKEQICSMEGMRSEEVNLRKQERAQRREQERKNETYDQTIPERRKGRNSPSSTYNSSSNNNNSLRNGSKNQMNKSIECEFKNNGELNTEYGRYESQSDTDQEYAERNISYNKEGSCNEREYSFNDNQLRNHDNYKRNSYMYETQSYHYHNNEYNQNNYETENHRNYEDDGYDNNMNYHIYEKKSSYIYEQTNSANYANQYNTVHNVGEEKPENLLSMLQKEHLEDNNEDSEDDYISVLRENNARYNENDIYSNKNYPPYGNHEPYSNMINSYSPTTESYYK